jgi:excinuclease UvrABC ATPase subunit
VKPALFSAKSEGASPTCIGAGLIYTDIAMMAGVSTGCEEYGQRFKRAARMGSDGGIYVLDEPTSGLHLAAR